MARAVTDGRPDDPHRQQSAYLALYTNEGRGGPFAKGVPLNHVGIEVDDLDAAGAAVVAAGLEPFGHDDYEPGRRFYFFDWDGIEFEVISYALPTT